MRLDYLPAAVAEKAACLGDRLCEIRIRSGRGIQLVDISGCETWLDPLSARDFAAAVSAITGHSLYAREEELSEGFIILDDGSRAGISGVFTGNRGVMGLGDIGSVCIRIAHEVRGCGAEAAEFMKNGALIVSPPGLGKTTLLRDAVRLLSDGGKRICLIDERGELAACRDGVPAMDVGQRTDVYSFCPKARAMLQAVRTMAPDIIAVDELGGDDDAAAVLEAVRCGVDVIATCHGDSLDPGKMRGCSGMLVSAGVFAAGILLGPGRGEISEKRSFETGDRDI